MDKHGIHKLVFPCHKNEAEWVDNEKAHRHPTVALA
jgi:hypothetical protein